VSIFGERIHSAGRSSLSVLSKCQSSCRKHSRVLAPDIRGARPKLKVLVGRSVKNSRSPLHSRCPPNSCSPSVHIELAFT